MKLLNVQPREIPDVKVLRYGRFKDERGYFTEPFRLSELQSVLKGFEEGIVQVNESFSKKNILRGLHFQWNPYMGKLVRTLSGRMVDLFLDIRQGSPFYGKISAYAMPFQCESEFAEWIWIPPGFAHGNFFSEETTIEYICTGEYSPGCEAGICPLSEDLDWSLCPTALKKEFENIALQVILSEKDKRNPTLTQWTADPRAEHFIYEQLIRVIA